MSAPLISLRSMTPADLDFAAGLVAAEGWAGETREVLEELLTVTPRGARVAEADGVPAGLCVGTIYTHSGFIGELVVASPRRGQGIGTRLFRDALSIMAEAKVTRVGLDGDLPALPIYEREGFRRVCRSLRFTGSPSARRHPRIRHISAQDLPGILAWDRRLFTDDRSAFLCNRHRRYPHLCLRVEDSSGARGYGFARPGRGVLSVGPVAADDVAALRILLEAFSLEAGSMPLRLGVLESAEWVVRWLRNCPDLTEQECSWRMLRGDDPAPGLSPLLAAIASAAAG